MIYLQSILHEVYTPCGGHHLVTTSPFYSAQRRNLELVALLLFATLHITSSSALYLPTRLSITKPGRTAWTQTVRHRRLRCGTPSLHRDVLVGGWIQNHGGFLPHDAHIGAGPVQASRTAQKVVAGYETFGHLTLKLGLPKIAMLFQRETQVLTRGVCSSWGTCYPPTYT